MKSKRVEGMTTDGRIVTGVVIDSSRSVLWVKTDSGAIAEVIRSTAKEC